MNSHDLFQRSLKIAPGGVHSPVRAFKSVGGDPIFFKSAKGAYMTSVEGKRYIDFCQSFGPNILGHLDEDVLAEVRLAIEEAWTLGACEPFSLRLAETIVQKIKFVEKIRFVCSGTEAVMSALRVARAATKRNLILKFEGCYHGHADSLLVKAGSGLAGAGASDSAGVSQQVASDTVVAQLDNLESVKSAFAKYGSDIAALIIEPLPANFGLLIQKREFLKEVCEMARANNSLVIFDEVISGFRVAFGGMAEILDITPDLVTYGKIIGGGFPVGAYAGRAALMNLVAPEGPVYQAGTLAANPIGMRAGLATINKIISHDVYTELEKSTRKFVDNIEVAMKRLEIPIRVSMYGSLFWLHVGVEDIRSPIGFNSEMRDKYKLIFHECLKAGLYLAPSAFEVGFVSFAHSEPVLKEASDIIIQAAKKVYGK